MLDALLVVALGVTLIIRVGWVRLRRSVKEERNNAIARARHLFAFLEAKGFRRTLDHHGDSFDIVFVEYEREAIVARIIREKTYWSLLLRRTDIPSVSFEAIEVFPVIGLGSDPCLPFGHQSPEALAASVEPVIDQLLAFANEDGMRTVEELRKAVMQAMSEKYSKARAAS